MAYVAFTSRIPYWDIRCAGSDLAALLRGYISSISVTYSLERPSVARIEIEKSTSQIEGLITEEMPLEIKIGWERFFMSSMFSGKVVGRPEGNAGTSIEYVITAVDNITDMSKEKKNRTFPIPVKSAIISRIIAENGYTPVVMISDSNPIPPDMAPIQLNETDLEFLYDRADRWNCVCWSSNNTIYFVDSDRAHQLGNTIRERHIDDLLLDYELNYRIGIGRNNIESVGWEKNPSAGGAPGRPGVFGADELGAVVETDDFIVEAYGEVWQVGPALREQVIANPVLMQDVIMLVMMGKRYKSMELLKKYFVPVTKGFPTRKNLSHAPSHKRKGFAVNVRLSQGDPFLRPPRTALLDCGTVGHKTSDLPGFLFPDGIKPQRYNINEVTTTLDSESIKTKLVMTI